MAVYAGRNRPQRPRRLRARAIRERIKWAVQSWCRQIQPRAAACIDLFFRLIRQPKMIAGEHDHTANARRAYLLPLKETAHP